MHNTTFFRVVALILVPILVAGSLFLIFRAKSPESDTSQDDTKPNIQIAVPTDPASPSLTVPDIETPTDPLEPVDPNDPIDDDHILTPDEPGKAEETEPTEPKPTEPTETNPVEPEKPTQPPVEEDDGDDEGGISIDGGAAPYDCGTESHHCDGPETHAYILNLELKGCPLCGKHNCRSFYAVDEWGNTCYDPSQCPKYDVHNDPVHYCQKCGKACGDGTNGTCVQYVNACDCPNCGEHVDSRTCHTCKEE